MNEQGRKLIAWIGGPIVVIVLLSQMNASNDFEVGFIVVVLLLLAFVFFGLRALVRVGDKRPEPVQVVQSNGAGWYPDQVDPSLMRWWDGSQWTSATLPRQHH